MKTFFIVIAFAIAYSAGEYLQNYLAVYHFGMIDSKFGGADGNFAIGLQVLPVLVALVTLSFAAGASVHHSWLGKKGLVFIIGSGVMFGIACSVAGIVFMWLTSAASTLALGMLVPVYWFLVFVFPFILGRVVLKSTKSSTTPV